MASKRLYNHAFILIVGLALAALATWQLTRLAREAQIDAMQRTSAERLALYAKTVKSALDKYRYLPFLIASKPTVQRLLEGEDDTGVLVRASNVELEAANREAGSDVLYVLDREGTTLAASNWREAVTFVGRNYAFRPYFRDALAGREGGFFAIGVTTGQPGYFMSRAVRSGGKIIGVAVVKVDLSPLQDAWREGGEQVFVTDANGIVFLASQGGWRYRRLQPLAPPVLGHIRQMRQYKGESLEPLGLTSGRIGQAQTAQLAGTDYLWARRDLESLGWRLHYLMPSAPIMARSRIVAASGATLALVLLLSGLLLRERYLRTVSRREAREAAKIRDMNARLAEEVEEHRLTEAQLRETQDELVQAGKLAGLGQMSAAIAHELNQPLAAMRTFLASAKTLINRNNSDEAVRTLGQISDLNARMAAIVGQLKTFARKSPGRREQIDLRAPLGSAVDLLRPALKLEGIDIGLDLPSGPVPVKGDRIRLEQVFVNLVRNGADAMQGRPDARLEISLSNGAGEAVVQVADGGGGLSPKIVDKVFDPFFTTKEVGQGVGLGLSISYGIVMDHNGDITAGNRPEGGAVFTVKLPVSANG